MLLDVDVQHWTEVLKAALVQQAADGHQHQEHRARVRGAGRNTVYLVLNSCSLKEK